MYCRALVLGFCDTKISLGINMCLGYQFDIFYEMKKIDEDKKVRVTNIQKSTKIREVKESRKIYEITRYSYLSFSSDVFVMKKVNIHLVARPCMQFKEIGVKSCLGLIILMDSINYLICPIYSLRVE